VIDFAEDKAGESVLKLAFQQGSKITVENQSRSEPDPEFGMFSIT